MEFRAHCLRYFPSGRFLSSIFVAHPMAYLYLRIRYEYMTYRRTNSGTGGPFFSSMLSMKNRSRMSARYAQLSNVDLVKADRSPILAEKIPLYSSYLSTRVVVKSPSAPTFPPYISHDGIKRAHRLHIYADRRACRKACEEVSIIQHDQRQSLLLE